MTRCVTVVRPAPFYSTGQNHCAEVLVVLHALERILAVSIGGLCVVLGYRLFLAVPEQRDSSGTFRLP